MTYLQKTNVKKGVTSLLLSAGFVAQYYFTLHTAALYRVVRWSVLCGHELLHALKKKIDVRFT